MTNEQFEIFAECYRRRYGRLAPGKDEPAASGQDSGDIDNVKQFIEWKGGARTPLAIHDLLAALCATTAASDIYVSGHLPCAKCGELVLREFTVPNDAWNIIIRKNGPETDQEYLCACCFGAEAVGYVHKLIAQRDCLAEALQRVDQCEWLDLQVTKHPLLVDVPELYGHACLRCNARMDAEGYCDTCIDPGSPKDRK